MKKGKKPPATLREILLSLSEETILYFTYANGGAFEEKREEQPFFLSILVSLFIGGQAREMMWYPMNDSMNGWMNEGMERHWGNGRCG